MGMKTLEEFRQKLGVKLTESEFWTLIDKLDWPQSSDKSPDLSKVFLVHRIADGRSLMDPSVRQDLADFSDMARFFYTRISNLLDSVVDDILDRENDIYIGSDGFTDLSWHYVGLGQKMYNEIAEGLSVGPESPRYSGAYADVKHRLKTSDFVECFGYLIPYIYRQETLDNIKSHEVEEDSAWDDLSNFFVERYLKEFGRAIDVDTLGYDVKLPTGPGEAAEAVLPDMDSISPRDWREDVEDQYDDMKEVVLSIYQGYFKYLDGGDPLPELRQAIREYLNTLYYDGGFRGWSPRICYRMRTSHLIPNMLKDMSIYLFPGEFDE